jgi:hypothetical protein
MNISSLAQLAKARGIRTTDQTEIRNQLRTLAIDDAEEMSPVEFDAWCAACADHAHLEPEPVIRFAHELVLELFVPPFPRPGVRDYSRDSP